MKKLSAYILVMAFLFSLLDWKVVQYTRLKHPEWTDWMHAHEKHYSLITSVVETALCTPALAFKPILYDALISVEASQEEQGWITHAPRPSWRGFYHLTDRRYAWTFVSWFSWFLYWLPRGLIWWLAVVFIRRYKK